MKQREGLVSEGNLKTENILELKTFFIIITFTAWFRHPEIQIWGALVVANSISLDRFFKIRQSIKVMIMMSWKKNDVLWMATPLLNRVPWGCLNLQSPWKNDRLHRSLSTLQFVPGKPNPTTSEPYLTQCFLSIKDRCHHFGPFRAPQELVCLSLRLIYG